MWATYGLLMAQILQTGEDRPVPSFFTACGPEQGVVYGPDLGQNQNQCGPDLGQFCFIWFIHGWHWAFLWLTCGLNLANRSGSPRCHNFTRYVGQMKVSGVGLIWASGILLSGKTHQASSKKNYKTCTQYLNFCDCKPYLLQISRTWTQEHLETFSCKSDFGDFKNKCYVFS